LDVGSGLCIVIEKEGGREGGRDGGRGMRMYVKVCKARVEMQTVRVTRTGRNRKKGNGRTSSNEEEE